MTVNGSPRPIGSFFEHQPEIVLGRAALPPWERIGPVNYVQTGRQALAVLATILRTQGRDTLLVPRFLCESMIVAFPPHRWILRAYEVKAGIEIAADDLLRVADGCDAERTVALTAAYFGEEPSSAHIEAVRALQHRGVRVIEDETHRVLGALDPLGDYGIASLRKTIPVADGAYVRGLECEIPLRDRAHRGWEAMDRKGAGDPGARALFAEASDILDSNGDLAPARASERTIVTLGSLDYRRMRSQRRANASSLRGCLAQAGRVRVISKAEVPSHLVIRVNDAPGTQAELAKREIFCPIHWPRPKRLSNFAWPEGLLSLPIDHRYGPADMARIADALAEVVA